VHDVVVVGAGPAGLSTALTLGRMRRSTLVVDAGHPRNARAEVMHNFVSLDGEPPAVFRARAREQLHRYPTVDFAVAEVRSVRRHDRGFDVGLSTDETRGARRIVLATGLVDILPPIPGIDELWGRSVVHCPYCHGYEAIGQAIAVLGAGPARTRLAAQLSRFGTVTLCTNGAAPTDRDTLDAQGIEVLEAPVRAASSPDGQGAVLDFASGMARSFDIVFVNNTTAQRSTLAADLGCRFLPDGAVEVDEFGRTSVPGVFAVGDMAHRATVPTSLSAVIVAAASGTVAASFIDQDLLTEDAALPDPFSTPALVGVTREVER